MIHIYQIIICFNKAMDDTILSTFLFYTIVLSFMFYCSVNKLILKSKECKDLSTLYYYIYFGIVCT